MILLHATCVAVGEVGVLLRGRPGAGKSDLALRLLDEGAVLVADDYCEIETDGEALIARAPARIAGKLEIRGVGIVTRDFLASARVGLVADLRPSGEIERLPETATTTIEGIALPWIALDPFAASATAKVRAVLAVRTREAAETPLPARVLGP